jgi:hypothetical protein
MSALITRPPGLQLAPRKDVSHSAALDRFFTAEIAEFALQTTQDRPCKQRRTGPANNAGQALQTTQDRQRK